MADQVLQQNILAELGETNNALRLCLAFEACRTPGEWYETEPQAWVRSSRVHNGFRRLVQIELWAMHGCRHFPPGHQLVMLLRPSEAEVLEMLAEENIDKRMFLQRSYVAYHSSANWLCDPHTPSTESDTTTIVGEQTTAKPSRVTGESRKKAVRYFCPQCDTEFTLPESFERHLRYYCERSVEYECRHADKVHTVLGKSSFKTHLKDIYPLEPRQSKEWREEAASAAARTVRPKTVWSSGLEDNVYFHDLGDYVRYLRVHCEAAQCHSGRALADVEDQWSHDRLVRNLLRYRALDNAVMLRLVCLCSDAHLRAIDSWLSCGERLCWSPDHAKVLTACLQYGVRNCAEDAFVDFACLLACKERRVQCRRQGHDPDSAAPALSVEAAVAVADNVQGPHCLRFGEDTAVAIKAVLRDPYNSAYRDAIYEVFCGHFEPGKPRANTGGGHGTTQQEENVKLDGVFDGPPLADTPMEEMMITSDMFQDFAFDFLE